MNYAAHILGRLHFRVEYKDRWSGENIASLWVPTSEGSSEAVFADGDRFARLYGRPLCVHVAGEPTGVTCGV
jgi:hypothetical protein